MRAWWGANRWYLAALAVLIPVGVVVAMSLRWLPYVERQPLPESVPLGETVEYSGARIELTDLRVLDGREWNASEGADVVVATIAVDVVEPTEVTYCTIEVVEKLGEERTWSSQSFSDSDYRVPDRFETLCSFRETGAYDLQLTFLVPAGQVKEPVVQLTSSAALPRVLRLR